MPSTYQLQIDLSGRAKCKGKCKQPIPKGELRFASIAEAAWDGGSAHWRRIGCLTQKVCQNAVAVYGDVASIPGFSELDEGHQAAATEAFDSFLIYGEAPSNSIAPAASVTPPAEKKSNKRKAKSGAADDKATKSKAMPKAKVAPAATSGDAPLVVD
mmetsp:Transcript_34056/g.85398  ORF Transcript_34056/g.85398 Transcript_34056/m.85398 type:complete len:157 (-) Transcript_34056:206-676(-)